MQYTCKSCEDYLYLIFAVLCFQIFVSSTRFRLPVSRVLNFAVDDCRVAAESLQISYFKTNVLVWIEKSLFKMSRSVFSD